MFVRSPFLLRTNGTARHREWWWAWALHDGSTRASPIDARAPLPVLSRPRAQRIRQHRPQRPCHSDRSRAAAWWGREGAAIGHTEELSRGRGGGRTPRENAQRRHKRDRYHAVPSSQRRASRSNVRITRLTMTGGRVREPVGTAARRPLQTPAAHRTVCRSQHAGRGAIDAPRWMPRCAVGCRVKRRARERARTV